MEDTTTASASRASDLDVLRQYAQSARIRIVEQPLPDGVCGAWHDASRTIFLHDRLNQRQRYCTLCHELIHAWHHDPGCGTPYGVKCERRCRRETALALISPVDYGLAEQMYEGNMWMVATELGVTLQVVRDYQLVLRDTVDGRLTSDMDDVPRHEDHGFTPIERISYKMGV